MERNQQQRHLLRIATCIEIHSSMKHRLLVDTPTAPSAESKENAFLPGTGKDGAAWYCHYIENAARIPGVLSACALYAVMLACIASEMCSGTLLAAKVPRQPPRDQIGARPARRKVVVSIFLVDTPPTTTTSGGRSGKRPGPLAAIERTLLALPQIILGGAGGKLLSRRQISGQMSRIADS